MIAVRPKLLRTAAQLEGGRAHALPSVAARSAGIHRAAAATPDTVGATARSTASAPADEQHDAAHQPRRPAPYVEAEQRERMAAVLRP